MENNKKIISSPQIKFSIIFIIWLILSILFIISCGSSIKTEPLAKPIVQTSGKVEKGEIAFKWFRATIPGYLI
jgi:hypothetical protein